MRTTVLAAVLVLASCAAPAATEPSAEVPVPAAVTPPPAAPQKASAARPSFADQIRARFGAWDANGDGRISRAEADRLVADPSVKGAEAAALAVLKRIQRSDRYGRPEPDREMLDRFTKGAVLDDDDDDATGAAAPGGTKAEPLPNIEAMYASALARVRGANRALFDAKGPDLRTVRQGPLGDCFFIAPVGAAVARDPAAVRGLFAPRDDGSCDVAFPGGRTVTVPPLTDTELLLTSRTSGGTWVNVFEKAYATVRNDGQPAAKQKKSVTDAIASGGSPAPVLSLLTRHAVRSIALRAKGAAGTPPTAEQAAERLPSLRAALIQAMETHALVCCSTWKEKEVPGLSPNHAYAVLGFDAATDAVTVWNPHANAYEPKGAPGVERGYVTQGGRFTVPLSEFARIFVRVVVEVQPAAAKR